MSDDLNLDWFVDNFLFDEYGGLTYEALNNLRCWITAVKDGEQVPIGVHILIGCIKKIAHDLNIWLEAVDREHASKTKQGLMQEYDADGDRDS